MAKKSKRNDKQYKRRDEDMSATSGAVRRAKNRQSRRAAKNRDWEDLMRDDEEYPDEWLDADHDAIDVYNKHHIFDTDEQAGLDAFYTDDAYEQTVRSDMMYDAYDYEERAGIDTFYHE